MPKTVATKKFDKKTLAVLGLALAAVGIYLIYQASAATRFQFEVSGGEIQPIGDVTATEQDVKHYTAPEGSLATFEWAAPARRNPSGCTLYKQGADDFIPVGLTSSSLGKAETLRENLSFKGVLTVPLRDIGTFYYTMVCNYGGYPKGSTEISPAINITQTARTTHPLPD